MAEDAYHEALDEAIREGDHRVRERFMSAFSGAFGKAKTPAEAEAVLRRYLPRCRYPLERAQILRHGEQITMWAAALAGEVGGAD